MPTRETYTRIRNNPAIGAQECGEFVRMEVTELPLVVNFSVGYRCFHGWRSCFEGTAAEGVLGW